MVGAVGPRPGGSPAELFPLSKTRVMSSTCVANRWWRWTSSSVRLGEGRTIGLVARVGVVAQRDVKIGVTSSASPTIRKAARPSLLLTALGERAPFVEGIDEGEEVGGIEEDLADIQGELADQMGGEVALDGDDGLGGDPVHLVPEALAGQLLGAEVEEAAQGGAFEPGGDLRLAAGIDAAIEGGDEQVGADGWVRVAAPGGDVAVDVLDQVQASGQVVQGHDGAELGDDRLLGAVGRRESVG